MKLLDIDLGRALWTFDLPRLAQGRSLIDTITAIGERYRFSKFPRNLLDVNKDKALEFNGGTFIKDGLDLRVGLIIYNNGVTADTYSVTDNSEAFLEDLARWLSQEHSLDVKSHLTRQAYLSQVNVQAKANLHLWNPKIKFVYDAITSHTTTTDGLDRIFNMDGIALGPSDSGDTMAPPRFTLERKWKTKPSENIYFSQASMRTRDHLALLEKIEAATL
jgi:hypothetical protein